LELPSPEGVEIYVYAKGLDMQSTLRVAGIPLVAGHADPELGVIVVTLPPGPDQRLEIERQIPHELMHIMLFQAVGDQYSNLPAWLKEGLASIAELMPNPDYYILLNDAVVNNTFISMESLCNSFPTEAASFYLSYAQSASFTRFLYEQYGQQGLQSLVERYSEGLGCANGAESALGKQLSELEKDWRRSTFGEDKAETAFENILPWLGIFVFALIVPIILMVVSWLRRKNAWNESDLAG
jgi:hypothetical protein